MLHFITDLGMSKRIYSARFISDRGHVATFRTIDQEQKLSDLSATHTEITESEQKKYRSLVARVNYLAIDRPDLQYAAKQASSKMTSPSQID